MYTSPKLIWSPDYHTTVQRHDLQPSPRSRCPRHSTLTRSPLCCPSGCPSSLSPAVPAVGCPYAGRVFGCRCGLPSCTLTCGPRSPPPRLLPTQARPLAVRLVQACLRGGPGWQLSLGTRERPTCASSPPGPVPPCPVVVTPRSGVQAQRGRAPAHQVPRTGGRWSRHWSRPRPATCVISAKLKSVKEVLHFSGPDLQRLTGLPGPDVQHLLRAAASHLRGSGVLTGGQVGEDGPRREPCPVTAPRPGWGRVQRAAGRNRRACGGVRTHGGHGATRPSLCGWCQGHVPRGGDEAEGRRKQGQLVIRQRLQLGGAAGGGLRGPAHCCDSPTLCPQQRSTCCGSGRGSPRSTGA